ncbi:MAG: DUF3194 domain-containing protein [Candidatus Baldrarchaeia archaeon]
MREEEKFPRKISPEDIERICTSVENAIRRFILSKIPVNSIIDYDVVVNITTDNGLDVDIKVDVVTSPFIKCDLDAVIRKAVEVGREKLEKMLRELKSEAESPDRSSEKERQG